MSNRLIKDGSKYSKLKELPASVHQIHHSEQYQQANGRVEERESLTLYHSSPENTIDIRLGHPLGTESST